MNFSIFYKTEESTKAHLFKSNDVVCSEDVKISNELYAKTLSLYRKKCVELLHCSYSAKKGHS